MVRTIAWGVMFACVPQLANAEPSAWTPDGRRVAIHQPDGAVTVMRRDGTVVMELDGPPRLATLTFRSETLVGTGPDGTFVWDLRVQELVHAFATVGPVALSDDGRFVATGHLLIEVGEPVPVESFAPADAVAFSDDGRTLTTMSRGRAANRPVPPELGRRRK